MNKGGVRGRLLLCGIMLLCFGGGMAVRHFTAPAEQGADGGIPKTVHPEESADGFMQMDLEGRQRRVEDWQGQVRVLNFWASWCAPCRREIPELMRVQERLNPKGVQILGFAIEEHMAASAFAEELGVNYPIMVGAGGSMKLMSFYGNDKGALPYTVILDRQGQAVYRHYGEITELELESKLMPLLEGVL
ncbi:MAG: TlpA family protein disulfide reductase [Candidatus Eutrophobiaceae bacterium]